MEQSRVVADQRHRRIDSAGKRRRRQAGESKRRGQLLPSGDISISGLHQRGPRLVGQNAKLQWLVGRSRAPFDHVDLHVVRFVAESRQGVADTNVFLGHERGKIRPSHLAGQVRLSLSKGNLGVGRVDLCRGFRQLQLAACFDCLIDESALIARGETLADIVSFIADRWVRVQSGLNCRAFRRTNVSHRLPNLWAVVAGHLLQIVNRKRLSFRQWSGLIFRAQRRQRREEFRDRRCSLLWMISIERRQSDLWSIGAWQLRRNL